MTTINPIQKTFLASPYFAVVGASKDQSKYGTKVVAVLISSCPLSYSEIKNITGPQLVQNSQVQCYSSTPRKGLNVALIRIHYLCVVQKEKELEGLETLRSIAELSFPKETSISIVTPPKVILF